MVNAVMQKELQAFYGDARKAVLIPNGVDPALYIKRSGCRELAGELGLGTEKVIMYTGRLSREKGLDLLIRSFARLRVREKPCLIILGSGPQRSRLLNQIRQAKLEHDVHLLPAVDNVEDYLQLADVFVMPSRFEGLSNAVLEAMACGLPVVATRVTGTDELISDGLDGVLVAADDAQAMAAALDRLLDNPAEAAALGRRAREKIEAQYDLAGIAARYESVYRELGSPWC